MDEITCKKIMGLMIKNKREALGLTQEELSARINLDQSNLSNIENGKSFPSFPKFCSIIEALDVEPNEMLSFLSFSLNTKNITDIEFQEYSKKLPQELKLHFLEIMKIITEQ